MAYSVYTYASQYADTGMVGVYLGTREDNLAECIRIVADQFQLMGEGRFDAAELERAKENLKGRIMLSMESTSNRASRLGKSVLTDAELLSLDRICAEIDAVDADAIAALVAAPRPERDQSGLTSQRRWRAGAGWCGPSEVDRSPRVSLTLRLHLGAHLRSSRSLALTLG